MKTLVSFLKQMAVLFLLAGPVVVLPVSGKQAESPPSPPTTEVAPPQPAAETESSPARPERLHDMVVIAGNATVRPGQTAEDVVVVRGDATLEGDVNGDVVVVLGHLKVTGKVDGDVVVVLGDAEINGIVTGDLVSVLTEASLGPNADVRGEIQAVGSAPHIDPAAKTRGSPEIVQLGPLPHYLAGMREYFFQGLLLMRPFPPRVGLAWAAAGLFLVFHLLLALVLAQPLRACMGTLREQPVRSFLFGLLTCVLLGPVSLLLSFTLVAPLLLWVAFFAACVFGRITVYGAAGAAIGRASGVEALTHPLLAVLIGSVLFYLGYMVPFVGLLVYGLVLPLGVGAVLIRLFDALRRERALGAGPGSPSLRPPGAGLSAASALVSGTPGPATHAFSTLDTPGPAGSEVGPGGGAVPPPFTQSQGPAVPPTVTSMSPIDALAQQRVGFWPRFTATLIDLILIGVVNALTFEHVRSFWVLVIVYHVVMWGWKATTLGGAVLNLRIVRLDGRPVDWQTAFVRMLGAIVSLLPLGLGFFWASWDADFQSWHDRIAGTTIVKPSRRVALV